MAALIILHRPAPVTGRALGARRTGPSRRPAGVARYRLLMALVLLGIVAVNGWARGHAAPARDVVGLASVLVWGVTLLGGLRIGPVGRLRDACRR